MRLFNTSLLLLSFLAISTFASSSDEDSNSKETDNSKEDIKTSSSEPTKTELHNVYDKKSYQVLLKTMREHQTEAVNSMKAVTDNQRLKQLIFDVAGRMVSVMEKAKKVIKDAKFKPDEDPFPTEDPLRESVAKIIENTVFYFEMTVQLPDFLDHFTHKSKDTKPLLKWCFEFVEKMDIYDKETAAIVLNGAQELIIVPRPKGYKNLNRKIYMKNMKQQEAWEEYQKMVLEKTEKEQKKKSEAKLKMKKTGPKLTEVRSDL